MFCCVSTYCNDDLKNKEILPASELRLLGQMAVIVFRNVPEGQSVSLANFPRSNDIKVIKVPLQYKLRYKEHNQRLCKGRIKTRKTWMG